MTQRGPHCDWLAFLLGCRLRLQIDPLAQRILTKREANSVGQANETRSTLDFFDHDEIFGRESNRLLLYRSHQVNPL